jgi:tetratricopeptide (TPR) repeat protein
VIRQGEYTAARAYFSESLKLSQSLQDGRGCIWALFNLLVVARAQNDILAAHTLFEKMLTFHRQAANNIPPLHALEALWGAYWLGSPVAWAAYYIGDYENAAAFFEKQLSLSQQQSDQQLTAWLLGHLGDVSLSRGDYEQAESLYQQSFHLFKELDYGQGIAALLYKFGHIALHHQQIQQARLNFHESLHYWLGFGGFIWNLADCLVGLAGVANAQAQFERAAQLLSAAKALHLAVDVSAAYQSPVDRLFEEEILTTAQRQLSTEVWEAAWAAGQALALEQAVAFALADMVS